MNEAYLASEIMKTAAGMTWNTNAQEIPLPGKCIMITTQLDSKMLAEVSWHVRVCTSAMEPIKGWFAATPMELMTVAAACARFCNLGEEMPVQQRLLLGAT
jgi:hypothetical protein